MVDAHQNNGIIDDTKGCRLESMVDAAASDYGVGNSNALVVCDSGPSRSLEPDCRRGVTIKIRNTLQLRRAAHKRPHADDYEAPKSRKYGDSRLKLLLAPATNGPTASATSNTTVLATMVRVWDAGFAIVADTVPELAPK